MVTTEQTKIPLTRAKPSYSVVLYDPAYLERANPSSISAVAFNETLGDTTASDEVGINPVKPKKTITKKAATEKFKLKKEEFRKALLDIFRCGLECNTAIAKINATIATPVTNAAIPGLAKILGTYRTYFDNAEKVERDKLFQILFKQCQTDFGKSTIIKSDKRTTEWHLLSRMFRQSDRRQASSDAKILKFAHAENVTEESFESWVKKYGTLSNILKGIPPESPDTDATPKKSAKTRTVYLLVDRTNIPEAEPQQALDALKKLADGKPYKIHIFNHLGRFEIVRYEISTLPVEGPNKEDPLATGSDPDVAPGDKEPEDSAQ